MNIVYIVADDLGWRDLSVEGSSFYETPNIDRIANEGMRFTNGYANCQVCSPSRASIMTGKYPPRHGVTDYIGAPSGGDWRKLERHTRLLPPDYEHGLRDDETTFAEVLRQSGFRTFFAGKWHLGEGEKCPENFGFDINKGGWGAGSPTGGYFSPYDNPKLGDGPPGENLPIRLARETSNFIEENQNENFLAYLSFYSVHSPIQTSPDRWEKYREKACNRPEQPEKRFLFDRRLPVRQIQDCPIYGGMIEAMDDAVGHVLNTLDRLGLEQETIVCFTSDNGGVSSGDAYSTSNLPLRGGKGRQWEGGIREPFHIKAPGITSTATTCEVPVTGMDFYPTFLDMLDIPMPSDQSVDGMSLLPLLRGESGGRIRERDLYWHYPHYGNQGGDPSSILRRGPWKLIHYYEDDRDELYHLEDDPGEKVDLASEETDLTCSLRDDLEDWLKRTDATRPEPDPEYDPAAEKARRNHLKNELMPELEQQHARYLDPDWQPNEDWWGSQIVRD
ncbi:MAG: sulfatase [Planctomycetota bacterium]